MTSTGSEMKSASTSSIIGPNVSLTDGDELEEREEHEKAPEEPIAVNQPTIIDKITIEKNTHLGISVTGK